MTMKHFWINVDKNEKRRDFMENQFKNLGLKNYRVSAVTPDDFDKCLVQKRPLTCKHKGCTSCEYEFACLCSHIKAMQMCINSCEDDDNWFVILEDDIYLPFVIDYDKLIEIIPKDAELVQTLILYGPTTKHLYEIKKKNNINFINWQYLLPSTGMYIISKRGAQKLIDMFYDKEIEKYDFSKSPFQIVADVLIYSSIESYASTFPLAYPYIEMGSEIHPEHLNAHSVAIKDIKEVVVEMTKRKDLQIIKQYNSETSYVIL